MTVFRALSTLLLSLLIATAVSAQAREMVSIDRPEVNMRAGPGTNHPLLWTLIKGYPLEVIGRRGSWLQVRDFENDRGWVYRPLTSKTPHHIVKVKTANLRSGASTKHRVVATLQYGEVLRTLSRQGDWVRVRTQAGTTGWVSRSLLWGW